MFAPMLARRSAQLSAALALCACVGSGSYGVRGRYQSPEPAAPAEPARLLLSAHVSRFGDEPEPIETTKVPRTVAGDERSEDRLLLVFADELDPMTVDARSFGILRTDGRRVRPTRAFLAPADESDENRSVTLLGNFGDAGAPPVAVHVIGNLYTEAGVALSGADAEITGPELADYPVFGELLKADASSCPDARQVVRTYWTDVLTHVDAEDLGAISLLLGDGRSVAPVEFDDQARREGECAEPFHACLGRADDNVLDLCVDSDVAVSSVRFAAGLFEDETGHASAAVDLMLTTPRDPAPVEAGEPR